MKKQIIIILILVFYSCTNTINLKGDWKATKLVIDNSREVDVPQFPITYFKDDNYIIYFESIYRYEIEKDSIAFYFGEEPDKLNYKMKIDIIDNNNLIFYYDRKVKDSTDRVKFIPYHSKWKRIE